MSYKNLLILIFSMAAAYVTVSVFIDGGSLYKHLYVRMGGADKYWIWAFPIFQMVCFIFIAYVQQFIVDGRHLGILPSVGVMVFGGWVGGYFGYVLGVGILSEEWRAYVYKSYGIEVFSPLFLPTAFFGALEGG